MAKIDLSPLIKIKQPDLQIKPVGITPAVMTDGKIQTQIQGKGEGIFGKVVNGLSILYSGVKQATAGTPTNIAANVGATTGTGDYETTQTQMNGVDGKQAFIWVLVAVLIAKLLNLF